jgi:type VI secretion system secreted protein Hcp
MATTAYLTAKGQKQGDIAGNVTEKGREGSIGLFSVSYQIDTPIDPFSGAATGKRSHKPVTIVKAIDRATPKLLEALVTNEILSSVRIEFWRPTPETEAPYFIVALTNALVVESKFSSPDDNGRELDKYEEYEEIQLTYQKIEWTWVQGGVTAQDDWNAPV